MAVQTCFGKRVSEFYLQRSEKSIKQNIAVNVYGSGSVCGVNSLYVQYNINHRCFKGN